ncbi:hypothetical protein BT93_C1454 [Corymbia citriodora subsp. variegata]|uniref:Uncharacterized protein n=1 Tax=Corymbia citriodora subsp. variegata TaxID=360336 RepID=A0A8T0CME0_CORYI|nr:hypothetical protein BT93_L1520 [Corymbia citriodora subsp. variegata]KAF8035430.1 hypothetical protein BT93_C1454 [Corymbia citriodora subsp. variegata]
MRGMSKIQPYPPCFSGICTGPLGSREEWPELVGQNAERAKAVIEKDNQYVTVVLVPERMRFGYTNFCRNRVYVQVNAKGNVFQTPMVG